MKLSDNRESVLSYGVIVMSITHAFAHIFDGIYPALFPVFREEFGVTLPQLGLLASVPYLIPILLSIPSGYFADRFSSKAAIALSFFISTSSALVVVLSRNIWMLAFAVSGIYLTTTFYHPASFSYTTKIVSLKNRSKALGLQSAGGPLGIALGPISLSLVMSLGWNWRLTYLFWIIPIVVVLLAVWRLKPEEETAENSRKARSAEKNVKKDKEGLKSLLSPNLTIFLVYTSVMTIGSQIIGVFLPLYLSEIRKLSLSETSLVYGSISLLGVVGAPLGGFFADRFGDKRWLLLVLLSATLLLTLSFVAPNTALFIVFYFLQSFFHQLGMPANSSIIAGLTSRSQRGLGYALSFLPGSIVGAVTPMMSGFLAEQMGLPVLFPLGIAISLASLLLLKFWVKV